MCNNAIGKSLEAVLCGDVLASLFSEIQKNGNIVSVNKAGDEWSPEGSSLYLI